MEEDKRKGEAVETVEVTTAASCRKIKEKISQDS